MTRRIRSENINYNYELVVEDKKQYFRTAKCIANYLGLSHATVRTKMRDPTHTFRQYKGVNIEIKKVKVPIYNIRVEQTKIEY